MSVCKSSRRVCTTRSLCVPTCMLHTYVRQSIRSGESTIKCIHHTIHTSHEHLRREAWFVPSIHSHPPHHPPPSLPPPTAPFPSPWLAAIDACIRAQVAQTPCTSHQSTRLLSVLSSLWPFGVHRVATLPQRDGLSASAQPGGNARANECLEPIRSSVSTGRLRRAALPVCLHTDSLSLSLLPNSPGMHRMHITSCTHGHTSVNRSLHPSISATMHNQSPYVRSPIPFLPPSLGCMAGKNSSTGEWVGG